MRTPWLTGAALLICLALLASRAPSAAATNFATVEAYDPATNNWTTKASMPTARSNVAVATVSGIIYAIGGEASYSPLSTVEAYNPATNAWTTKAAMPTARSEAAAVAVNNKIYVFGGNNGPYGSPTFLHTVEEYDPTTNTWTTKADMPTGRAVLAAAGVNGIVYVMGGSTDGCNGSTVMEAYDPATNSWTTQTSMPTGRGGLAAAAVGAQIYAVGGAVCPSSYFNTNEAFAPAGGTWSTKAGMPTARYRLGVGVVNGLIYAVGGQNASGALATVEAYDPAANTWSAKTSMPTARSGLAAAAVNNIIYAIGGGTEEPLPPTPTGGPVGGIAGLPNVSGSSGPPYPILVSSLAAALLALAAGTWYARRRWLS
jgi:N-acetylneuraminic acid mutarotase